MSRKDNTTIRKRLIEKRGYICEKCGYEPEGYGFLDLHHIISVNDGGKTEEDNLIFLCEKCHMDIHGYKKVKYLDKGCELWHQTIG